VYTADWAPQQDHDIYDDIRAARLKQIREIPVEERIIEATVPETVVYLATATLDSSYATPELVDIYQHAYRDYLQTWVGADLEDLPAPLNEDPQLTDYEEDMYRRIRIALKTDRDRWFVANRYDNISPNIPKSYWGSRLKRSSDEGMDATVQETIKES
jgi:hypothetical protein